MNNLYVNKLRVVSAMQYDAQSQTGAEIARFLELEDHEWTVALMGSYPLGSVNLQMHITSGGKRLILDYGSWVVKEKQDGEISVLSDEEFSAVFRQWGQPNKPTILDEPIAPRISPTRFGVVAILQLTVVIILSYAIASPFEGDPLTFVLSLALIWMSSLGLLFL